MEQSKESDKDNGVLTKRRVLKVLLIVLLVLLVLVFIFVVFCLWKRAQVDKLSAKESANSSYNDGGNPSPNEDILPPPLVEPPKTINLDALVVPEMIGDWMNNLTFDFSKEIMIPEMSMLLFAEYLLNRNKCPSTSSRDQLSQFFPISFGPRHELGIRSTMLYWFRTFLNDLGRYNPQQVIERNPDEFNNPQVKNLFINILETNWPSLYDFTSQVDHKFAHMLTWFYDPKILLCLQEELALENDEELVEKLLEQACFILNHRRMLTFDDESLKTCGQRALLYEDVPSHLDWPMWKDFCNWKTQRYILHTYCQVSFDQEDDGNDKFQDRFIEFIKLPRASPWIIYLTWMSMMYYADEQAKIIQKYKFLPSEMVVGLQQCYNQMMENKAPIEEIVRCVDGISDPNSILDSEYVYRSIFYRVPMWPLYSSPKGCKGQNIQWLFIAHHLDQSSLSSLHDNSFVKFPNEILTEFLGIDDLFINTMAVNFDEYILVDNVRLLLRFCSSHLGDDHRFVNLDRFDHGGREVNHLIPDVLKNLNPENNSGCQYPLGLLLLQSQSFKDIFDGDQSTPEEFSIMLENIVTKYRTGTFDFTQTEREVIDKILKSDVFDKYVSQRFRIWGHSDIERWSNASYLETVEAALGFIYLADLARFHVVYHCLLFKLLPIASSYDTLNDMRASAAWNDVFREANLERYKGSQTLISLLKLFEGARDKSSQEQRLQEYMMALELLLDGLVIQRDLILSKYF